MFLPHAVVRPYGLAPARHRYAEQECDKQACERRLPGDALMVESGFPGWRAVATASLSLLTAA